MDVFSNMIQAGFVMAEANAVITMRLMGMAGVWSVSPSENAQMLSEKVYASTKAVTDASRVAMSGGRPDEITAAVIKPIRQKTRSNARRLSKRGPKSRF
jgi:hypothetical protein